jgi:carbon starvation protein
VAAVLPVWLLLAPRDYLSTFLKIGVVVGLAIGILITAPMMRMPQLTQFAAGGGPVWSGNLFPFLFITIACGAVSGFHALISSGTTPKMVENELHTRFIGYGAMLMESFVAIMALIAASVIEPGVYFAMNSPPARVGTTVESVAEAVSTWGFVVTPEMLNQVASDVGEPSIISRTGGAPTLAVGMAQILNQVVGGEGMMAFWYHFAILFEALFILTAVDAGTRAGRFMLQDLIATFIPSFRRTDALIPNMTATALCVSFWGYYLYQGVVDPLGGINTLWPLFGTANQMLAAMALVLGTVVLFRLKKDRHAWVTLIPTTWLLIVTLTAGTLKVVSPDPAVGFLAQANRFRGAIAEGTMLAPATTVEQMERIAFNNTLNAGMSLLFILILLSITVYGIKAVLHARASAQATAKEIPYQRAPAEAASHA